MKNDYVKEKKKKNCVAQQRECVIKKEGIYNVFCQTTTGKTNGFPFLDVLGYLKNTPRGGGHLGIFWVGMCRPGFQIGTPLEKNFP